MKRSLLLSFMLMLTLFQAVLAQTRSLSGRVTDQKTGEGLPGVTVLLKGTTNGASTNSDGAFNVTVPATGGTLVFSSVGYVTQERAIGNETQFSVGLATDSKQLGEIVVTGYGGSQDVKDITGSVAQVGEKALLSQPVQSFDQALTGRAAGVQINSTGGALADQTAIRIRGVNSISNGAGPLIVVDGVPISSVTNSNTFNSGGGARYNPLADINPNDIESVDVLKDASAAAIYGSRAANGVLIITTKRGKAGQNRVAVNSYIGFQRPVRRLKLLGADDFIAINNEKAANRRAGSTNGITNLNIPATIAAYPDLNGDGTPDQVETNWQDQIFRSGALQDYQVALSGGTDKASYYSSADWTDQKGILNANRLRRGAFRLNVDVAPKTWLKAGLSSSYSKTLNNGVLTDGYLAGATVSGYNAPPNVPVYNADGSYYLNPIGNLGNGGNNIAYVQNNYNNATAVLDLQRNNNTSQRIIANGYLTALPLKGLSLTSRYGIDYLSNVEDQYSSPVISGLGRQLGQGLVQNNQLDRTQFNWQNYANYDRTFGTNHTLGLTAGIEVQQIDEKQVYTPAADFADPKFKEILDGLFTSTLSGGGTRFANGFQSYFGRANYSFASRYYASFSARYDGASVFGADNRYGFFPGGSVGWRVSEEPFFQSLNSANRVTDLKLRASYGLVGNSNGIGSYASRTLIGGGQYADVNGFSISQVGNPALQWETSKKLDLGIDVSFFQSRLSLVVDYFNNQISGLVLAAPVLRTTGLPNLTSLTSASVTRNVGEMYNRGVELTVNTVNVRAESGFQWTSSFNATWIKNRVQSLATPNDIISGQQRASADRTLSVYYLPNWAGVNSANGNAQFVAADGTIKQYDAAYATTNAAGVTNTTGRWLTQSGDATTPITTADYQYQQKGGIPTWYGGFDNTFSFKGVDLGIFFQYSGGNMIYNATRSGLMTTFLNNNISEIKDRWTTPGQETNVQKLVLQDNVSNQASSRWLENGNFLRFRQVSLGYNLPKTVATRIGLSNLRIYGLVQNLYTFTHYTGTDPEVNSNRTSNIAYGTDNRSVPQPRSFTLGINFGI
ncbi:TonB-dependent receptor [Hymenobacter sp. H14-R3]|uniref:SusC/RagA family TonB-linked outer membrane protein n=1 Tax=Hymenobacter sp. H14-R3 TaxID=3046308 RepID=UPI0024B95966|nr:TonB-dependent receptor [Hymenobacter sp. H14-R3]MDJ0364781.1 TonB-dependent receptor [Hymenobacter sp. H14-R3]